MPGHLDFLMKSSSRSALCQAGSVIAVDEEPDRRPANLSKARQLVAEAAGTGADLASFEGALQQRQSFERPLSLGCRWNRKGQGP